MQLKVIKADGTIEQYLHTKVIGAVSNALAAVGQPDIAMAEQLAEVVTYFLYQRQKPFVVSSGEIFSIIEAVLIETGHEDAAIALSERHFERRLKRARTEVVSLKVKRLSDACLLAEGGQEQNRSRWNKSRIVEDLVKKHKLSRQTARTVASMVEERIFNMGITLVPASLIKQIVIGDAAAVLRAEQQLQAVQT